jgi:hypothetical protein
VVLMVSSLSDLVMLARSCCKRMKVTGTMLSA